MVTQGVVCTYTQSPINVGCQQHIQRSRGPLFLKLQLMLAATKCTTHFLASPCVLASDHKRQTIRFENFATLQNTWETFSVQQKVGMFFEMKPFTIFRTKKHGLSSYPPHRGSIHVCVSEYQNGLPTRFLPASDYLMVHLTVCSIVSLLTCLAMR